MRRSDVPPGISARDQLPRWLRVGLVLGALAAAWLTWMDTHPFFIRHRDNAGDWLDLPLSLPTGSRAGYLTARQRFLLEGDTSRPTRHERQRAIWEAQPDSRVYLGNYLTALAAGPGQETNQLAFGRSELAAARKLEPENARVDYLEAAWLAAVAANIQSEAVGKDESGKRKTKSTLKVHDRTRLDEAMGLLQAGIQKPYYRRYSAEMLREQLEALGPPRRFVDLVQRTAIAAGVLLPDLAKTKSLAITSRLYAELLIGEGKTNEALPYLGAWQTLTRQLNEDSFTLIDVLVVGGIANDAEVWVPPLYRQIGLETEAEHAATNAAAIFKPVGDWRAQRKQDREPGGPNAPHRQGERILIERAGALAAVLLPALGQWPDAAVYEPERRLEYTVAAEVLMAIVSVLLLAAMGVSLVVAWRWQWLGSDPATRPLKLDPDAATVLRILVGGVALPLLMFDLVTRFVPLSGHAYSLRVASHKLIAEFGLLMLALGVLPMVLSFAHARRRLETLGVPTTRWSVRWLKWPLGAGVLLLVGAWCVPASGTEAARVFAIAAAASIGAALVLGALLGFAQGIGGESRYGRFYGTSFRALIPVLAAAIIVLGVGARPLLLRAEHHYIQRDTLMYHANRVGFTQLESELVEQLRGEVQRAFAIIAPPRSL
jgi:hypothetical protein